MNFSVNNVDLPALPHPLPSPTPDPPSLSPLPPPQAYASLVPDLDLTTAIVVRALEGEEVEGGWV